MLLGVAFILLGLAAIALYYFLSSNNKVKPVSQIDKQKNVEAQLPPKPTVSYGDLYFFYGSQQGTAQKFANILGQEAQAAGFVPHVEDLNDFTPEQLNSNIVAIFLMATHYEGDPTDNAVKFFNWLKDEARDNRDLSTLRFSVFGLGNTQYEHYNAIGRKTNAFLEKLGGNRIYDYGEGDDNASLEDDFNAWKTRLFSILQSKIPAQEVRASDQISTASSDKTPYKFVPKEPLKLTEYNIQSSGAPQEYDFQTKAFLNAKIATVKSVRQLRQNLNEGSTLHMEIDLRGTGIQYQTAQNLAIFAENDPLLVQQVAQYLNVRMDEVVEVVAANVRKHPFPSPLSVGDILTYFCDFQGPVMKKYLKDLVKLTKNEEVQKKLTRLASSEGKDDFVRDIEKQQETIFSLIVKYDIHPTFFEFIALTPRLGPRLFTISSSNLKYPEEVHVTNSLIIERFADRREKWGVCSRYFQNITERLQRGESGIRIRVDFKESSFRLPAQPHTPVVMIGPGTGVAPFIAFAQQKEVLLENGIDQCPGDFTLFFGCRYHESDYIFREQLEAYEKTGVINRLAIAFSREKHFYYENKFQPNWQDKLYVQDLLSHHLDEKQLFESTIYICGAAAMGKDVVATLIALVSKYTAKTEKEAKELVQQWEKDKKLIKELW